MFLLNRMKKKPVADAQSSVPAPVSAKTPDFVTEYVIHDPMRVLVDYRLFFSCSEIPVALDKSKQSSAWSSCKKFPASAASRYLKLLSVQSDEFRANPLARTIVEYKLGQNSFYIFPTLEIVYEQDFFLFMNKDIRKHMAEMLRKYKTLSK